MLCTINCYFNYYYCYYLLYDVIILEEPRKQQCKQLGNTVRYTNKYTADTGTAHKGIQSVSISAQMSNVM